MMYLVMNGILIFFFFIIIRWIPRQTCRMCLCLLSLLSAVVCFLRSVSDKLTNVKDMHHFHTIIILYFYFFLGFLWIHLSYDIVMVFLSRCFSSGFTGLFLIKNF